MKIYLLDVNKFNDPLIFREYYDKMPIKRKIKIDSYKHNTDKIRSISNGYLLKKYVGNEDKFIYNENDKPYLKPKKDKENIYFNLSDNGTYSILVVDNKECGIDIQKIKDLKESTIKKTTVLDEYNHIINAPSILNEYTKMWCYKESYIKYKGLGKSKDPRDLKYDFDNTLLDNNHKVSCYFHEYYLEGYKIVVCSESSVFPEMEIVFIE